MQFFLVAFALYVGYSRVSDYKHHWSDVLVGLLQGALVAGLTVSFLVHLLPFFLFQIPSPFHPHLPSKSPLFLSQVLIFTLAAPLPIPHYPSPLGFHHLSPPPLPSQGFIPPYPLDSVPTPAKPIFAFLWSLRFATSLTSSKPGPCSAAWRRRKWNGSLACH